MQTATTRQLNGATVRVVREALGIPMKDLAARAQVSEPFLSRCERGARQPSPAVMVRLAKGLGVPLDAISYPTNIAA